MVLALAIIGTLDPGLGPGLAINAIDFIDVMQSVAAPSIASCIPGTLKNICSRNDIGRIASIEDRRSSKVGVRPPASIYSRRA